jgi:hypothetical protein
MIIAVVMTSNVLRRQLVGIDACNADDPVDREWCYPKKSFLAVCLFNVTAAATSQPERSWLT